MDSSVWRVVINVNVRPSKLHQKHAFVNISPQPCYTLPNMNFNEYQEKSSKTALHGHSVELLPRFTLGLCGETGEIAELIKKLARDDNGQLTDERKEKLKKELGDVLWYLSQLCTSMDLSFSEVAELNIEKLYSRLERGKITGDGDDR